MKWMMHFHPLPDDKILELGCHKGANLRAWAADGLECHGVDIAPSVIEQCPEGLAEVGDIQNWISDVKYDWVVMSEVLNAALDPMAVLLTAHKALKPGGQVYITCLTEWFTGLERGQQVRTIDGNLMMDMTNAIGFEIGVMLPLQLRYKQLRYKHLCCIARKPVKVASYDYLESTEAFQAFYDELHQTPAYDWKRRKFEWMKHFHPRPGSAILDLGCSSGRNVLHYAREGHEVAGVECSRVAVDQFGEQWLNEPEEVRQRCRVIHSMVEDWESYGEWDHILLTEVLEHVQDPTQVLKVARKALAEGGEIYVTGPTTFSHDIDADHVRKLSEDALRSWSRKAGLRVKWVQVRPQRLYAILEER